MVAEREGVHCRLKSDYGQQIPYIPDSRRARRRLVKRNECVNNIMAFALNYVLKLWQLCNFSMYLDIGYIHNKITLQLCMAVGGLVLTSPPRLQMIHQWLRQEQESLCFTTSPSNIVGILCNFDITDWIHRQVNNPCLCINDTQYMRKQLVNNDVLYKASTLISK